MVSSRNTGATGCSFTLAIRKRTRTTLSASDCCSWGAQISVPLQTRVGIATGLVVGGDLIGSGEAQERRIIRETPNIAARLHGLAEPNGVVIAESTRRLLGNLFELADLGLQELKGIQAALELGQRCNTL